jgi:hypothetical protein
MFQIELEYIMETVSLGLQGRNILSWRLRMAIVHLQGSRPWMVDQESCEAMAFRSDTAAVCKITELPARWCHKTSVRSVR